MSNSWPVVRLGEVVRYKKEFVTIDDLVTYKRPRVRLHAQGIVFRDEIPGALIKTKKQQVCRFGEFLVAEIDAKVGGFGIVPSSLDGAIVSSHYFLFGIDESKLSGGFLDYFIRTPAFREQIEAQGSTNYAAIRPGDVLDYEIPLPTIAEQQRIVARIDELAAQIGEARALHEQIEMQYAALLRSIVFKNKNCVLTPMNELVALRKADVPVEADKSYHFAGVYSFGRGVFSGPAKSGSEFAYKRLTLLHTGDFVYPKLMAWEGALAVVPSECNQLFVSPEFMVFEIDQNRVLPETLDVYFRTPTVWPKLSGESTGTNVRRRRLHPDDFLAYKMPLPSMQAQKRLRAICAQHALVRPLQVQILNELDALLPSILDRAFNGEL